MARALHRIGEFLMTHGTDLLVVAGVACVVWGVAGWSGPAAKVVLGGALLIVWWRL